LDRGRCFDSWESVIFRENLFKMLKAENRTTIWVLTLIGAVLLALQVLALGTRHFHDQVNSDDLYPYVFAQDVLHHRWSLPGWTLSSAPYYFPDFSLLTVLVGVTGWAGASIPAYAVLSALLLALAAGWLLKEIDATRSAPWLRGFILVNAIVALGFLPHLDRWVWWQFAPGFHGGAVLVTTLVAALAAMEMNRGPSRGRLVTLTLLLWLGMWSDSFVIVEAVIPLAAALIFATWQRADFVTPVRRFLGASVAAFALLVFSKWILGWQQIFFAGRVFRYAPTPMRIASTALAWWQDLWGQRLLMTLWIAIGLALAAWVGWRSEKKRPGDIAENSERERIRFLVTWAGLSSALVVGALWFMGYWHDVSNARYLVSLQTIPWIAWAASLRWPGWLTRVRAKVAVLAILGMVLVGAAIWAGSAIRRERLVFPYPDEIAQLDQFCRERNLTRGLGDYWTLHYVNVLGRAGVRISALRATANSTYPASAASFWNANVYGFVDRDPVTGKFSRPTYTFIVVNRLDESSLRARYGAPREVDNVGPWKIWILADPVAVSDRVIEEVRQRLQGRRWDLVKSDIETSAH
jgi:hypothetical protein